MKEGTVVTHKVDGRKIVVLYDDGGGTFRGRYSNHITGYYKTSDFKKSEVKEE